MSKQFKVMNKTVLKDMNQALAELQLLHDEACKAEQVAVPGMELVKQNCVELAGKIEALKRAYFSQEI